MLSWNISVLNFSKAFSKAPIPNAIWKCTLWGLLSYGFRDTWLWQEQTIIDLTKLTKNRSFTNYFLWNWQISTAKRSNHKKTNPRIQDLFQTYGFSGPDLIMQWSSLLTCTQLILLYNVAGFQLWQLFLGQFCFFWSCLVIYSTMLVHAVSPFHIPDLIVESQEGYRWIDGFPTLCTKSHNLYRNRKYS